MGMDHQSGRGRAISPGLIVRASPSRRMGGVRKHNGSRVTGLAMNYERPVHFLTVVELGTIVLARRRCMGVWSPSVACCLLCSPAGSGVGAGLRSAG